MERDGSGVTGLLGLDGFVVGAQVLDEASGEWWLAVETTEERAWCPACGVRAVGHGRRRVVVRDLPLADVEQGEVGAPGPVAPAGSPILDRYRLPLAPPRDREPLTLVNEA
ncbi:MAG TPA: transposase family protein [Acidimicrobiales bacterium]